MGMFDYIDIEFPLKCKCGKELKDFQTKDMGKCMCTYVITKDKKFREGWKRYLRGSKKKAKKYCYIFDEGFCFYTDCECGKWHDFKAIILDGKLAKLNHWVNGKKEKP